MKGIPTSDLWILIAEGEGAASAVVADLRAGLHKFTCCCPGDDPQKCGAQEWLTEILSDMENQDDWSRTEDGKPLSFSVEHECGWITITALAIEDLEVE
jgi:hypothetical protein